MNWISVFRGPPLICRAFAPALHVFPYRRPRRIFERRADESIYVSRATGIKPNSERLQFVRADASVISTLAKFNAERFVQIRNDLSMIYSNSVGNELWKPDVEMTTRHYRNGGISILDALDYELHPDLAAEIIHWFQSPETNPRGAQLFCSLHNVGVLRQPGKG